MKTFIYALFAILFLSGCVTSYQYASIEPNLKIEDINLKKLQERNLLFWEYYSSKDFDHSYMFELPHLRFQKSLEWYKVFNEPNRKGYKITLINITPLDSDRAIVKNRYEDSEGNRFDMEDRWVFVGEDWYHYFEFSKLPTAEKPF